MVFKTKFLWYTGAQRNGVSGVVVKNPGRPTTTQISNVFIDEYMAEANGEFVKVYLYLLRLSQGEEKEISVGALADVLNHTEADVERALRYWEKQGVLSREGEELLLVPLEAPKEGTMYPEGTVYPEGTMNPEGGASPDPGPDGPQEREPVSPESLERLERDENFRQALFVAETYLARTLSPSDIQMFAYLYDELHFPEDLLEYLVEYCVGGGHRSIRYMESVALEWHAEGWMTAARAKEEQKNRSETNRKVMKAFGIAGRVLSTKEQSFVERWRKEYGMPLPVIEEACGATMTAIHEPSFEYTDSVLKTWKDAGVQTVEEARAYQETRKETRRRAQGTESGRGKNRFQNYDQRKIDYDELLSRNGINLYSGREV